MAVQPPMEITQPADDTDSKIRAIRAQLHSASVPKAQRDLLRSQLSALQETALKSEPVYIKSSYRDFRQMSGAASDGSVKMARDPAKNLSEN